MLIYDQTLDPSETRDFVQNWGEQLQSGETIATVTVAFVDAAGTTQPVAASATTPNTRVWLAGGNSGSRAVFTVRITTSGNRTLEDAFGVNIVDTTFIAPAETEVERLTREIAEIEQQRTNIATGEAVIDAWRDGRRIRVSVPSLVEFERLLAIKRAELRQAQIAAGIEPTPGRTAIGVGY